MVYILNSEVNPLLANELEEILKKFKTRIKCKRDNCGPIAQELIEFLNKFNYDAKIVRGTFEVDLLNYLDPDDFSKQELKEISQQYGDLSLESMKNWIFNNMFGDSLEDFYRIPHYWVQVENLELDPSQKMFHPYIVKIPGEYHRYRKNKL